MVFALSKASRYFLIGAVASSIAWVVILITYLNSGTSRQESSFRTQAASLHHSGYDHNKASDNIKDTKFRDGSYYDTRDAGRIMSEADRMAYEKGFKRHSFNEYLSSHLSISRSIPDAREPKCLNEGYNLAELPKASVVICFYNEAISVLLRTIRSIKDRTPKYLLQEIILVDDYSDDSKLKKQLDDYVQEYFPNLVVIFTNTQRQGLIRSRMVGAKAAKGKVLVFLDSHVEVNVGWLEPLLSRIKDKLASVVLPVIDIIDADTFEHKASPLVRGGFTWSLRFSWEAIPSNLIDSTTLYVSSPTMAGGVYAMHRDMFFQLGGYDEGMDIWGAENLEMSFRIWLCGGRLELSLCSRVAHIFRNVRPYSSPTGEDTMTKNTLRMANVWLGNSKDKFFRAVGNRYEDYDYGDISERVALKTSLHCHNFDWYLENVYDPDNKNPVTAKPVLESAIHKGKLKHKTSGLCIMPYPSDELVPSSLLELTDCSKSRMKWYELSDSSWRIGNKLCLDVLSITSPGIRKCTGQQGTQSWKLYYHEGTDDYLMYNQGVGLCLTVRGPAQIGSRVELNPCNGGAAITYQT